jgi:16S rRNA (cytidine1402-2'-O)-methyltransferase
LNNDKDKGILYICGTPIGNLKDITFRVLEVFKKVKLIAAEDTRHTKKLLNFYKINTPITSYFEYNKFKKAPYLIEKLKDGEEIALVSDAGMPGISDPGYVLINSALENNIKIVPIPGVSALITALVVSGLPTERFVFEGFITRKSKKRREYLKKIENEEKTIIFYEAPHRLKKTLKDILDVLGDRKIAVARELTKKYEEIIRGNLSQVLEEISDKKIKGEITLILQGKIQKKGNIITSKDEQIMENYLKKLSKEGYSDKEIIKISKEKLNFPKNVIYKKLLEMKSSKNS